MNNEDLEKIQERMIEIVLDPKCNVEWDIVKEKYIVTLTYKHNEERQYIALEIPDKKSFTLEYNKTTKKLEAIEEE